MRLVSFAMVLSLFSFLSAMADERFYTGLAVVGGSPRHTQTAAAPSGETGGVGVVSAHTANSKTPPPIKWIQYKQNMKLDPNKPTWWHFSKKEGCTHCRRAEQMFTNHNVREQAQRWNCVWVDDSPKVDVYPTDLFQSKEGKYPLHQPGCPGTAVEYAWRLHHAYLTVTKSQ